MFFSLFCYYNIQSYDLQLTELYSAFFNFQENAKQENCRQYSCILFFIDKLEQRAWRRENLSLNQIFYRLDNSKWKMHTGACATKQKYISIYIYLYMKTFFFLFLLFWLFRRFWLTQIPRTILHHQLALTKFGKLLRYEKKDVNSKAYM